MSHHTQQAVCIVQMPATVVLQSIKLSSLMACYVNADAEHSISQHVLSSKPIAYGQLAKISLCNWHVDACYSWRDPPVIAYLATVSSQCLLLSIIPAASQGPAKCPATNPSIRSNSCCRCFRAADTCAKRRFRLAALCILSLTPE